MPFQPNIDKVVIGPKHHKAWKDTRKHAGIYFIFILPKPLGWL